MDHLNVLDLARKRNIRLLASRPGVTRQDRWVDLGRDRAKQTGRRIAWARGEIEVATGPEIAARAQTAAEDTARDAGRNGARSVGQSARKNGSRNASRGAKSAGKSVNRSAARSAVKAAETVVETAEVA